MQPQNNSQLQQWLRFSIWFFAFGFIFWFGSLNTFNLGIDQELGILRTDERVWIGQGRWAIFFLNQNIYTQPIISYFPHLVFVALAAISYTFIIDALAIKIEKKWQVLTVSMIFIANPIWLFIAEFYTNLVPTALGLLSCSIALWLFAQQTSKSYGRFKNLLYAAIQIGLIFFAVGNYQAYILVMSCMIMVLLANRYLDKLISLKTVWLQGLQALAYILIALVAHQLFLKRLYRKFATPPDYISNFINTDSLIANPKMVIESVYVWGKFLYAGSPELYKTSLSFVGYSILIGVIFYLYRAIHQHRIGMSLLLLVSLFVTPLLLQIIAAGFWRIPLRVTLALPIVIWFFAAYALLNTNKKWLKIALFSLAVIANIQILHTHSRYSSMKQLTLEYDQRTATLLFERILDIIPDYSFEQSYPLSVQGGLPYKSPYPHVISSAFDGSLFYWDDGNSNRISQFMHILNFQGLTPATEEQNTAALDTFKKMPVWPAKDSVQLHDGVILVKFAQRNNQ